MHPPFVQQAMNAITKEDTFKLFIPPTRPNIYDVVGCLPEACSFPEARAAFIRFFTQIVQQSEPYNFYHTEAGRMVAVVDGIFTAMQLEYAQARPVAPRDANDEVVDLYMESLKNFAAELDEKILQEHIWYLEK